MSRVTEGFRRGFLFAVMKDVPKQTELVQKIKDRVLERWTGLMDDVHYAYYQTDVGKTTLMRFNTCIPRDAFPRPFNPAEFGSISVPLIPTLSIKDPRTGRPLKAEYKNQQDSYYAHVPSEYLNVSYKAVESIIKNDETLTEWLKTYSEGVKSRNALETTIRNGLLSCSTYKRVAETFPKFKHLLPENWDSAVCRENLPVMVANMDELLRNAGWGQLNNGTPSTSTNP